MDAFIMLFKYFYGAIYNKVCKYYWFNNNAYRIYCLKD